MFKYLLLWAAIAVPVCFAQNQGGGITQPGAAQISAVNPLSPPLPCTASSPLLLYTSGGTQAPYTCGPSGVYIAAPGGSTSTLAASGIGAAGAAGSNKLVGPANVLVKLDGSGNGASAVAGTGGDYVSPTVTASQSILGPLVVPFTNGWQVNPISLAFTGASAGAQLISALNNGSYPCNYTFDMRGISSLSNPGTGPDPIEIGSHGCAQTVILPDTGTFLIQTTAHFLATPAPPTLAAATGTGAVPAGTYFFKVNYRTGDAVSISSTEVSTTLASTGQIVVTGPATCPQYAGSYDVTISSTSGTETLQKNAQCGQTATWDTPLYPVSTAAPTVATPLPAFIVHNNQSQLYAAGGVQNLKIQGAGAVGSISNMLAFVGLGFSRISNLFFYDPAGTVAAGGSVVYDSGAFDSSVRDHIETLAGHNTNAYKLTGQANHIVFNNNNFGCNNDAATTFCTPLVISWNPEVSGDSEGINDVQFIGGGTQAFGAFNLSPSIVITGKSAAGSAYWQAAGSGVGQMQFLGFSVQTGVGPIGVQITDANNITFDSPFITQPTYNASSIGFQLNSTYNLTLGIPATTDFAITGTPFFNQWGTIIQNNVSSDPNDSIAGSSNRSYTQQYVFGGGSNSGQVLSSFPIRLDGLSPITSYGGITTGAAGSNSSLFTSYGGFTAKALNVSTVSNNYNSAPIEVDVSTQHGGGSTTTAWTVNAVTAGSGSDVGSTFRIAPTSSDSGSHSIFMQTLNGGAFTLQTDGLFLLQPRTSAGTSGTTNKNSPGFRWANSYGNGTSTVSDNCSTQLVTGTGTTPTEVLTTTCSNAIATVKITPALNITSTAGTGTATAVPQAGAGAGATAPCAPSHVCDSYSGEFLLTSGAVPAIGSDLIITLPATRTNLPNCAVEIKGGTLFLGDTKTVTTNTITISTGAALAAATAYTINYVCGGN